MLLKIKNIGKIERSEIKLNGITVIAGENNTGKSSFGKALYCMFNAFYNADKIIYNERVDNVRSAVLDMLYPATILRHIRDDEIVDKIMSFEKSFTKSDLKVLFEEVKAKFPEIRDKLEDRDIGSDFLKINKSLTIDSKDIQKTIVNRYLRDEFKSAINHINKPDSQGDISLTINNKNLTVNIVNNECIDFIDDVGILYSAIYIDTPFIIDKLPKRYALLYDSPPKRFDHRSNLKDRLAKDDLDITIIEETLVKQKANTLLSQINSVVGGEFGNDKDTSELAFIENGLKKPLPLASVSTGIKTFLIIKRLLENGEIKERGVLILDEPEVHLHPDWQLRFAEILILLQKEFNLTLLLTTHSPYFLRAIEVYSDKHNVQERCNFYLAESNGDGANAREVTSEIDAVYKQLARPFQKLEDDTYGDS
jgi:predicted ATPase